MQQQVGQLGVDGLALFAGTHELVLDLGDAGLGGLGFVALAFLHEPADLLRQGVALGLQRLFLHDGGAAGVVELGELGAVPVGMAVAHRLGDGFLVIADELYI